MAKANEITGIDCAADALEWAAIVLRARFKEVIELRGAALDFSDIEGVHAMRVVTRRLRSALRDFLPLMKRHPLGHAIKALKEIAEALGTVRDQDVAILALEKLHVEAQKDRLEEGVEMLLEERRAKRDAAQLSLIKTIDADHLTKLQEDFTAALVKAMRKSKQARVISFNEAGRDAVAAGLEELCDLGASLYDPFNVKKLHEMRIAAKRLRYAVELFTACWGARKIAPFTGEIATMQSLLGELHDGDAWINSLGKRLSDKGNGTANQNEHQAAVWLMSKFVKKRTKNYRAALQLWSKWQANDFAGRMRATVGVIHST